MRRPPRDAVRLAAAWATVAAFLPAGGWASDPGPVVGAVLFVWLLGVMLWSAFGVIRHADHLAEALGEPLGTLILTISIVAIEVGLISAVMLGGGASPTVGRDTMFAVMMIVLNGVLGLCLLIGGLRHHEQSYSLPGATAYLGVIIPLTTVALVLPSVTTSSEDATLTAGQSIAFSVFTLALYGVFLLVQTGRHRAFFAGPEGAGVMHGAGEGPAVARGGAPRRRAARGPRAAHRAALQVARAAARRRHLGTRRAGGARRGDDRDDRVHPRAGLRPEGRLPQRPAADGQPVFLVWVVRVFSP